jgi:Spy/CpxP family protein refolding chaperone
MKYLKSLKVFKSQTAKKYVAVIAAASLASFASLVAFAESTDAQRKTTEQVQHHKHHGGMDDNRGDPAKAGMGRDHSRLSAVLELTAAQKDTLKAGRAANETIMKDVHEKLRIAHEALDKAAAANADDAMLNMLSADFASLVAQKELSRAKTRRDLVKLLTPEQKQKLATFEVERKSARHGKGRNEPEPRA